MLFQKDIEPRCCYCQRGTQLDEEQILCVKKGVVSPGSSCRSFRYDPLKRIPTPPVTLDRGKLKEEDFSLYQTGPRCLSSGPRFLSQKISRTAQAAARKPARSAHRAAGTA